MMRLSINFNKEKNEPSEQNNNKNFFAIYVVKQNIIQYLHLSGLFMIEKLKWEFPNILKIQTGYQKARLSWGVYGRIGNEESH